MQLIDTDYERYVVGEEDAPTTVQYGPIFIKPADPQLFSPTDAECEIKEQSKT